MMSKFVPCFLPRFSGNLDSTRSVNSWATRVPLGVARHRNSTRWSEIRYSDYLLHGVRYAFPAVTRSVGRGIPTAHAAKPLSDQTGAERLFVAVALTNRMSLVTSAVVQPASGTEFGPMAQDWHAVTGLGGGTNISMTSMSGLLLGAIQGLSQAQGIFTNAAGARFALVVNAQTNGFIFVPR